MAEITLTNCYVKMGGSSGAAAIALSTAFSQATISYKAELQDKTAFTNGTRRRIAGLKDWNITLNLHNDFASTDLDK